MRTDCTPHGTISSGTKSATTESTTTARHLIRTLFRLKGPQEVLKVPSTTPSVCHLLY